MCVSAFENYEFFYLPIPSIAELISRGDSFKKLKKKRTHIRIY